MIYNIKGYINNYGFCVKKNSVNILIYDLLKKYFSVKPELNYENEKIPEKDKYFNVYYEDDKYIVMPKFSINLIIDILKINDKKNIKIDDIEYTKITFLIKKYKYSSEKINFDFKGELRDYQKQIIDKILQTFNSSKKTPKGGLIKLSCGGGKCLGVNTPILMYDGSIKLVQNILIGDKLMGDNSEPRIVLNLSSGIEQMYKVIQEYGDSYIVNKSHILSLYNSKLNKVVDISITDYLELDKINTIDTDLLNIDYLYGYRTNIIFKSQAIEIEPYLLGAILKKNKNLSITLLEFIKKYNLNNDIYIPANYKINTPIIQLQVLAGLIDSFGEINQLNNCYDITVNKIYEKLKEDILFIIRSLNFSHRLKIIGRFNIITIYDSRNISIPTQKYKLNNQTNNDISLSEIKINYHKIFIIPLQENNYYGFEIDGNRRFLLGDCTVTHNTMLAIYLSWSLGLKTLVVTHKEFLMEQWKKRIEQFTTAKIGYIRQNKIDVDNKDIVVGMLRSLSTKNYSNDILHQFGLVIYDEVHHTGSRVDSQVLLKTSAEYTIGLSATPDRIDGMTKIINWNIGNILYEMEKKYNYRVLVKKIYFRSNDILFREKKRWFQGRFAPNHTSMTENITKIETRNQLIVNFIDILKSMGRKILILSYRVEHLEKLKNMIDTKIKEDMETHIYNSYFYMGKTKRTEKDMAEKDGDIIFATMQLAEEGLDISHLDTVIFALPVPIQKDKKSGKIKSSKTLIQSIGRILRNDTLEHLTQIPLVIDISDMFSIYSGWSDKRDEIYTKKNWFMQNYYWNDSDYQYKTSNNLKISENSETILKEDKNINPMNIVLDDISDEEFIEKNLILKDDVSHSITDITSDSEDDNSNIKSKPSYGFGKIKR
jgi:superfamily II DNA or RNA helicase